MCIRDRLVVLIGYIFVRGLPHITGQLLSTAPSVLMDTIGILPNILNTLYIILFTLLIALPLGVGAAVYLTEYEMCIRDRLLVECSGMTRKQAVSAWACCKSSAFLICVPICVRPLQNFLFRSALLKAASSNRSSKYPKRAVAG